MKKLFAGFIRLKTRQKAELVTAFLLTLFLLVGAPIHAWFATQSQMETLTKIKAPPTLDIKSGNKEAIEYLKLKDISIEEIKDNNEPKRYVFCVKTGTAGSTYDIQLAHTTNIPFTYKLYRATEVASETSGVLVEYKSGVSSNSYYYLRGQQLSLVELNGDTAKDATYGRRLAKNNDAYYSITYQPVADDGTPEIYAVPLYSQVTEISPDENDSDLEYDYFILELDWAVSSDTAFNKWNQAIDNKETDIIYIAAKYHT